MRQHGVFTLSFGAKLDHMCFISCQVQCMVINLNMAKTWITRPKENGPIK